MALSKAAPPGTGRQPAEWESEFRPVRTRRAFEGVCDQIRRQVADGTLQPGYTGMRPRSSATRSASCATAA